MQFSLCFCTKVVSLSSSSFFCSTVSFLTFMMIWNPKSWDETLFLAEAYIEFWDFWPFSPQHIIHLFFSIFQHIHCIAVFFCAHDIVLKITFSKYFRQLLFIFFMVESFHYLSIVEMKSWCLVVFL